MKIPKSKRARRVGVEIQKVVAEELRRLAEEKHPGSVVSVPEVRLSDDLSLAAIYVSILGAERPEAVQKDILKGAGRIRKAVAQGLRIRKIPEFRFVWDDTMERADRIEQLLNEIHSSSSPSNEDDGGSA